MRVGGWRRHERESEFTNYSYSGGHSSHVFFSLSLPPSASLSRPSKSFSLSLSLLPQLVATCTLAKRALAGAWLHIEISSGIFIMKYSPCRYPHVRRKIVSMD